MKKSMGVGIIEGKEVGGDDPIEYFFRTRMRSTS